jgi:trk system potassium uptake protein TrkH
MNYRMIAYSVGRILVAVAATMLAPLGLSLFYGESIALAYVIPIVISVLIGLCVSAKAPKNKSLYGRDGMFIVAIGWIVISIIGCLPFYISGQIPSFVDSFFETVSGFTTTGSSILTNVEALDKSLLFWRSFTHWLGGGCTCVRNGDFFVKGYKNNSYDESGNAGTCCRQTCKQMAVFA